MGPTNYAADSDPTVPLSKVVSQKENFLFQPIEGKIQEIRGFKIKQNKTKKQQQAKFIKRKSSYVSKRTSTSMGLENGFMGSNEETTSTSFTSVQLKFLGNHQQQ